MSGKGWKLMLLISHIIKGHEYDCPSYSPTEFPICGLRGTKAKVEKTMSNNSTGWSGYFASVKIERKEDMGFFSS